MKFPGMKLRITVSFFSDYTVGIGEVEGELSHISKPSEQVIFDRQSLPIILPLNIQGPAQITPPFNYRIFHYKIISVYFYNITKSHSSTPYDIFGEMFKLKL